MNIHRPDLGDVDTSTARGRANLLNIINSLFDAVMDFARVQTPDKIPMLQAITQPTHQAARTVVGDYAGIRGPRAMIVIGRTGPLDGGEGVFVWDATSVANDDDTNTLQPNDISLGAAGRWRKGSF